MLRRGRPGLLIVAVVALGVLVLSGYLLVSGLPGDQQVSGSSTVVAGSNGQSPAERAPPDVDEPDRAEQRPTGQPPGTIRLPRGGTAELVRAEVDRSGTLPVPDGVDEATWWGSGLDAPRGATVLAGHVNWQDTRGPFAELWQADRGAQVTVLGGDGEQHRYRISEVLTVTKEELPRHAGELFGQGGEHRLVLVTCGGGYTGEDQGYDENRIAVAQPL